MVTSENIDRGCELNTEIKRLEKEFGILKEKLKEELTKGTYVTPKGNSLVIACTKKWSDIPPESAKTALRTKRLGRNFLNCVKVNLASLRKLLTDKEIDALRVAAGSTIKLTFK